MVILMTLPAFVGLRNSGFLWGHLLIQRYFYYDDVRKADLSKGY